MFNWNGHLIESTITECAAAGRPRSEIGAKWELTTQPQEINWSTVYNIAILWETSNAFISFSQHNKMSLSLCGSVTRCLRLVFVRTTRLIYSSAIKHFFFNLVTRHIYEYLLSTVAAERVTVDANWHNNSVFAFFWKNVYCYLVYFEYFLCVLIWKIVCSLLASRRRQRLPLKGAGIHTLHAIRYTRTCMLHFCTFPPLEFVNILASANNPKAIKYKKKTDCSFV